MMLDPQYIKRASLDWFKLPDPGKQGGQELLLIELMSVLVSHGIQQIWLPFDCPSLEKACKDSGIEKFDPGTYVTEFDHRGAVYFGTPTIVDNKKLFDESAEGRWDKRRERLAAQGICRTAAMMQARLILSGLGSGDISVEERIEDMRVAGGEEPKVIMMKDFGEFKDWIIATEPRAIIQSTTLIKP